MRDLVNQLVSRSTTIEKNHNYFIIIPLSDACVSYLHLDLSFVSAACVYVQVSDLVSCLVESSKELRGREGEEEEAPVPSLPRRHPPKVTWQSRKNTGNETT